MSKNNKSKVLCIVLIFLSVFSLSSNTQATSYKLGVQENDEWEMEVTFCDSGLLNRIFGAGTSGNVIKARVFSYGSKKDLLTVGAKAKFKIVKIKEETWGWSVNFKYWDWTTENSTSSGITFREYEIAKNPVGLIWEWSYRYKYYLILPIPLSSYLQDMSFGYGYSSKDNKVIHKQDYMHYDLKYQWTYNSSIGIWIQFSITANDMIIYEIKQINNGIISGYEFFSFFLITTTSIISLIYLFCSKRNLSYVR